MPQIGKHCESPLGSFLGGGAYLIKTRINSLNRICLLCCGPPLELGYFSLKFAGPDLDCLRLKALLVSDFPENIIYVVHYIYIFCLS